MNRAEEKFDWLGIGLFAAIVCFVPMVVYARVVIYEPVARDLFNQPGNVNFFTWYKAAWLNILTATCLIYFFLNYKTEESRYYRPLGIMCFLSVVSAVFAKYPSIAFYGSPERHEGLWANLCYFALVFLGLNLIKTVRDLKVVLSAVIIASFFLGLVGALQFFGHDYFYTTFTDKNLIPNAVLELTSGYKFPDDKREIANIFSTFGNSNFNGSYIAMLFPISFFLLMLLKGRILFFLLPLNIVLFINLIGSKSRAGLLATIFSVLVSLFFLRSHIFKKAKLFVGLICLWAITFGIMEAYSIKGEYRLLDTYFTRKTSNSNFSSSVFNDLVINKFEAKVIFGGLPLNVKVEQEGELRFFTEKGDQVPYRFLKVNIDGLPIDQQIGSATFAEGQAIILSATNNKVKLKIKEIGSTEKESSLFLDEKDQEIFRIVFKPKFLPGYEVHVQPDSNILKISRGGPSLFLKVGSEKFSLLDHIGNEAPIEEPPNIGFKGREMFGSGRGYIWSRTFPLLKKALLIGYGPDTFITHFPNFDIIGKLKYWGTMKLLFEKPHSFYLLIFFNSGLIALLSFIYILLLYLKDAFKIGLTRKFESISYVGGTAIMIGIIGYLIAGIFNDSVLAVAPVFWGLLGTGIAANKIIIETELCDPEASCANC